MKIIKINEIYWHVFLNRIVAEMTIFPFQVLRPTTSENDTLCYTSEENYSHYKTSCLFTSTINTFETFWNNEKRRIKHIIHFFLWNNDQLLRPRFYNRIQGRILTLEGGLRHFFQIKFPNTKNFSRNNNVV